MIEVGPVGGLSFRIAAAMISITCLFYTTVMRHDKKRKLRSRLLDALLLIVLIGCITGIVSELVADSDLSFICRLRISYICKYIYYLTHFLLIPLFWLYVLIVCEVYHGISKAKLIFRLLPMIFIEIITLLNPALHLVFRWDENLRFYRGPAMTWVYVISTVYLMFILYLMASYWKCMHAIQKVAMFYFIGLAIIGTLVQMVFPDIKCELMAEAIGFMGIMVMIENDDSRTDYKTRAGNRAALAQDIRSYLLVKRDFYIICVRVLNAEVYRRIVGYENYDLIMIKIADFLINLNDKYEAYRTTGGNFFLMCPDATQEDMNRILEAIQYRFDKSWALASGSANIKVKILCAKCPEEFDNADDIFLLSETEMDESDKVLYRGADLDFLYRRVEVERAIIRGMNEGNFRVMYRPVYHKDLKIIVSAEALLTLNDSILGEIPFSEFNSVAEKTGFAVELQNRMTDSAFQYIQSGLARNNTEEDIRVICIHIISVQVLKNDYVAKVKELMEKYSVTPNYIVFDVSDTIVMQAGDIIESVEDQFRDMGINLFLVNNDVGFLGMDTNSIDKFSGVVINVSRHYSSAVPEQADMILRNRCTMIRELNKSVIFMGVDSRELFDRIKDMPVDLIMGDCLSEIVTKNELQTKFWHKETYFVK